MIAWNHSILGNTMKTTKKTTKPLAVVPVAKPKRKKLAFSQLKSIEPEFRDEGFAAWSLETKAFLDLQNLKNLFYSEGWVYICVDAIAQPISQLPWGVYREKQEGKKTSFERVPSPLDSLLDSPNRYQSASEFKYVVASEFCLMGNAILADFLGTGSMYLLATEHCQIDFDQKQIPKGYRFYQSEDHALSRATTYFPWEQVCHIKRANPSSIYWGLSPFIPTKRSILFNRYSGDYLNAFYQKGASPQMYLELDSLADEKQLVRLMRSFEQAYTGRRNMRRTMVLPKGVKATMADVKIADQGIIELINLHREEIISALRIPKHALGLQESGSLGSQEHKEALKYFWTQSIIPTCEIISQALTSHYKKYLRPGETIKFDLSNVPVLQDDLKSKAELANLMTSTLTLNEVRDQVWGLPAMEGGDALPGKAPTQPTFPFQLSMPAQQSEVKADVDPIVSAPGETDEIGKWYVSKKADHIKAKDKEYDDKLTEGMPEMVDFAADLLGDQWMECLKVVKKEFVPANTKSNEDISKNIDEALKELEDKYKKTYENNFEARMDLGYEMQASAGFYPQFTEAMLAAQDKDAKGRSTLLKERQIEFFRSVRKTTTESAMLKVGEALKNGWTVDKLATEIGQFVRKDVAYRAQMIARTEMLTAMSYGAGSMTQTAKEVIPDIKKVWVATMDGRTRDDHMAAHGQLADKNGMFTVGGEKTPFPRGPGLSAGNSIQCRCRYIDVLPEDVEEYSQELEALKR
jgi:HK97 family phage portal protein